MFEMSDQNISLEKCPALVLNADYRPLSYYPLSLWSWQDSIKSVFPPLDLGNKWSNVNSFLLLQY